MMVEVECWSWVKAVLEIVDNSPSSSWLICVFALFTFVLISFVFLLLFRFDNDDSGLGAKVETVLFGFDNDFERLGSGDY